MGSEKLKEKKKKRGVRRNGQENESVCLFLQTSVGLVFKFHKGYRLRISYLRIVSIFRCREGENSVIEIIYLPKGPALLFPFKSFVPRVINMNM